MGRGWQEREAAGQRNRNRGNSRPRGAHAASDEGNGGDEDMDLASLLATFPPDVRQEALLAADDALLAALPPALLAEAQAFVRAHASRRFFLYYAPTLPHANSTA